MKIYHSLFFPTLLVLTLVVSCEKHEPAPIPPTQIIVVHRDNLPTNPDDAAWTDVPIFIAKLLPQDLIEPKMLIPSTSQVRVQAVTDSNHLVVRLSWNDAVLDNLPGAARFSDACAIQFPQVISSSVPDPRMGEKTQPVEITYWRASWQAVVDGRGDTIRDLYPNALVDHYPCEAAHLEPGSDEQRKMELDYAPARALGNHLAGPRDKPVQDLIATGPGSLTPAETSFSDGWGKYSDSQWQVTLSRPLPHGLEPPARSVISLAVWEGSKNEAGSRKMRSLWIPISLEPHQ